MRLLRTLAALVALLVGIFVARPSYAYDVYPNVTYETSSQTLKCSLRAAVLTANANVDILPCHLYGSDTGTNVVHLQNATYTLNSTPLDVGSAYAAVIIQGNGSSVTTVTGSTWRVQGYADYQALTLDGSRIEVQPNKTLNMHNCVAKNGFAPGNGGAVNIAGGGSGFFTNVWFKNNQSASGGAIFSAPFAYVSVSRSTFSGNVATGQFGGAAHIEGSSYFNNTTFSGNHAQLAGGALYLASVDTELDYCTVTDNSVDTMTNYPANGGTGVWVSGTLYLYGTILSANKRMGAVGFECRTMSASAITSLGGNLIGAINGFDDPCVVHTQSSDRMSVSPHLGVLGSAVGPSPVSAPAHLPCRYASCQPSGASGNLLDAFGGAANCSDTDQAGACRNVSLVSGTSDHQDIGSVERQQP
jgi:predicted outer membrane repeat protein